MSMDKIHELRARTRNMGQSPTLDLVHEVLDVAEKAAQENRWMRETLVQIANASVPDPVKMLRRVATDALKMTEK